MSSFNMVDELVVTYKATNVHIIPPSSFV